MKIAIVVDDFKDGAGNIAQIVALDLKKEHEVALVMTNLHSTPRYDLSGIEIYEKCTSISSKNKILGLFSLVNGMKKFMKKTVRPDVIISFLSNNNSVVCLSQWFSKTPVIVSERSNPLAIIPKAPWDKIRRIAYKRANVVTVQFEIFKNFDGARFADKTLVTSNIVKKSDHIKENYETDIVRFVTFGRLSEIKRMDLLIDLFAQTENECKNTELHIYGEGPKKDELILQAANLGLSDKIFFHGYKDDVHKLLCENDVYLMTSLQEGFPNSLSEAMAAGLPSVCFRCHDGILDMTENDTCGFSVPEGDTESFAEKMKLLAKDASLREKIGKKALSISDRYSNEKIILQWKQSIEKALCASKKKAK